MFHVKHITNDTEIALIIEPGKVEWEGPFADFCASNKFEDGEIAEIEEALNRSGFFINENGEYEVRREGE